jgi:ABC-type transport system involved in multi-copper enzyme maturation permease subunit
MFATLVLEREPLHWSDLLGHDGVPGALETWLHIVGGFSAVAVVVWLIVSRFARRDVGKPTTPPWQRAAFRLAVLGMVVGYGLLAIFYLPVVLGAVTSWVEGQGKSRDAWSTVLVRRYCLLAGSGFALLAVSLPALADLALLRFRARRIWALARVSFKEALRSRVLWGFSAFLLVLLFASWFIPYKPEDQVRNYVRVIYWAMAPLLLIVAGLLAAFSIPTDVRSQTIHTIVTKPVQRFEIVLGRFLGYVVLMSLVLIFMTGVGLLYMLRQIDPEAETESLHARMPLYGNLQFRSRDLNFVGENVGREWEYRRYIAGGAGSSQRAIWIYNELPADLAARSEPVPFEFSFDIFRTLKGEEGKGVFCSFLFLGRHYDATRDTDYRQARDTARRLLSNTDRRALLKEVSKAVRGNEPSQAEVDAFVADTSPAAAENMIQRLLAEKFGIYEISSMEVVDYHTQAITVPAELFGGGAAAGQAATRTTGERPNALEVQVKCESGGQYLGMARYDFYLLAGDGSFAVNFVKGALGLWLRLCLVIGIAVALSTYLSGVIAALCTACLYGAGLVKDYVQSVVDKTNVGGGPMEALQRLITKKPIAAPLDSSPATDFARWVDVGYRFVLRIFTYLFPNVDSLDWTSYVSEGFNIAGGEMVLLHAVLLTGYLVPCALLAYYLIKSREIASSM